MDPYYSDEWTTLYLGDCRKVLPALGRRADVAIVDPPYNETSLKWDRWPDGWPAVVAGCTDQMWCFGSMRMFFDRLGEFTGWKFAQDIVWEKNTGSGFQADRFRRVHENAVHWYRGTWGDVYKDPQRESGGAHQGGAVRKSPPGPHMGKINPSGWVDDGTRLVRSVIRVGSMRGRALHPTQKPIEIVSPLIEFSCPPGGRVLVPFAGSGSDLVAARLSGRRAVGIEGDERYCEVIATRLSQAVLLEPPVTSVPVAPSSFPETPLFDVS